MRSRTEIIQIKGECCTLASKFHAGTGAITRSPVTTGVMQYQCNTVLQLDQCSHSQSQPSDLFVYLFIYLFIY
jgi:hypothetical protein